MLLSDKQHHWFSIGNITFYECHHYDFPTFWNAASTISLFSGNRLDNFLNFWWIALTNLILFPMLAQSYMQCALHKFMQFGIVATFAWIYNAFAVMLSISRFSSWKHPNWHWACRWQKMLDLNKGCNWKLLRFGTSPNPPFRAPRTPRISPSLSRTISRRSWTLV